MPETVFGQLSPKVVIVTTPNVEFNVLFPGLKGFRHYDHKFEWTRAEFQEWLVVVLRVWTLCLCWTVTALGSTLKCLKCLVHDLQV